MTPPASLKPCKPNQKLLLKIKNKKSAKMRSTFIFVAEVANVYWQLPFIYLPFVQNWWYSRKRTAFLVSNSRE